MLTMIEIQAPRVCVRLPCELSAQITFTGGGREHIKKARISNISTTGIQILSPSFVATGQRVEASFKVPGRPFKNTYRTEVMRVESLKGRTTGHYPYALGAKFIESEKTQERQISEFISNKLNGTRRRTLTISLLIILGIIQIGRAILHTHFGPTIAAILDIYNFSASAIIIYSLLSVIIGSGLFFAALMCAVKHPHFLRWGIIFSAAETLLCVAGLIIKHGLLVESAAGRVIWCSELFLAIFGIEIIVSLVRLNTYMRQMDRILSTEQNTLDRSKPTFTIL